MARNTYFNQYTAVASEQTLLEDLIIESIRIYGIDAYYLPRTHVNLDLLYSEDASMLFDDALEMELFVKSFDGFMGQQDFLSKFGLQVDESITFSVAQKRFTQSLSTKLIGEKGNNLITEAAEYLQPDLSTNYDYSSILRPREGDLIWIPIMGFMYEIKHAENAENFYQLGRLYTYEIKCDRLEYSSERIDTDVPEIDAVEDTFTQDLLGFEMLDEEGDRILVEFGTETGSLLQEEYINEEVVGAQNSLIQEEVGDEDVLDFSERNPFALSRTY
jgi:hypothetical protein